MLLLPPKGQRVVGEEAANHVRLIYMALILTKWRKSDCPFVLFLFITVLDV